MTGKKVITSGKSQIVTENDYKVNFISEKSDDFWLRDRISPATSKKSIVMT